MATESPSRRWNREIRAERFNALRGDTLGLGMIGAALLLLIGLAVWLANQYPIMPDILPLHFDSQGLPDRIAERSEIIVLPVIGLLVNLWNIAAGLLLRLRFGLVFASYLLWGGAALIQLLLWIGAWNLIR